MQQRILLIAVTLFFTCSLLAQSLVISYQGTVLDPPELTYTGDASDYEIVGYAEVTNTSTSDIEVRVQRYELDMVPGTQSAICWGLCYQPNIDLSPHTLTIPAGETNTLDFAAHYYPDGNAGVSEIAFVFFDDANPEDSVMLTTYFNAMVTSIAEIHKSAFLNVYPNPASDKFNIDIQYDAADHIVAELLSITGAIVKRTEISGASTSVNVSDLPGGLYFYRININNSVTESGRLVIRR